ncbi:hypothetical protein RUM43_003168 [Polyplax serrata]|uniref:Uncharacterized protein n=1 Tax=Polyplax serrata TaxID=468196 RepID=A0AAN8PH17_POLSC
MRRVRRPTVKVKKGENCTGAICGVPWLPRAQTQNHKKPRIKPGHCLIGESVTFDNSRTISNYHTDTTDISNGAATVQTLRLGTWDLSDRPICQLAKPFSLSFIVSYKNNKLRYTGDDEERKLPEKVTRREVEPTEWSSDRNFGHLQLAEKKRILLVANKRDHPTVGS